MSRGHKIWWDRIKRIWKYSDTNKQFDDSRTCTRCSKMPTKDGHDACIANLPGVRNACCGHGTSEAYVQFEDHKVIRGFFDHHKTD